MSCQTRISIRLIAGALGVVATGLSSPARAASDPVASPFRVIAATRGVIEEGFALDARGGRLAFIQSEESGAARLRIVEIESGNALRTVELPAIKGRPDRVLFAGATSAVVIISRDPQGAGRFAQHHGADGKLSPVVGPMTDFATTTRAGQPILVGWGVKEESGGRTSVTVTQHRLEGLAPAGPPRTLVLDKDRMVRGRAFRLTGWQDGYSQVIGIKPGRGAKGPADELVAFDVLAGSVAWQWPLVDAPDFARSRELREAQPNRTVFVRPNAARDALELVDDRGRARGARLPAPFANYDATGLRQQEDFGMRWLYFGLPVNAAKSDAVASAKADKPFLDLFVAQRIWEDTSPYEAKRILRVPMDARPVTWVAGPTAVAVLRKQNAEARGGGEIELYRVAVE